MGLESATEEARRAERRAKQEFLKLRVIAQGHRPEDFHAYMLAERPQGDEVDNWTLDELESHVAYFQRQQGNAESETLRPGADASALFAKRLPTAQIGRSGLTATAANFRVKSAFPKSLGLFRSNVTAFAFDAPGCEDVTRLEEHFAWLAESLEREFPLTPLPPPPAAIKSFERPALDAARQRHEQFLRDCLRHPQLRHSRALELFLTARSTAEFGEKARNFSAYLDKAFFLGKNVSRRAFEASGRDLLAALPTVAGVAEAKLSPRVQTGLRVCAAKLGTYHAPVTRLERLLGEFDKHVAALTGLSAQVVECLRELGRQQSAAISALDPRPAAMVAEQGCCDVLGDLTARLGELCGGLGRRLDQHLLAPLRHLRDYSLRVAAKLRTRDDLLAELKAWRRELSEKLRGQAGREQPATPQRPREISAAQVLQEELAQFQRFGELCGFVNLSVFREAAYFDGYAATTLLEAAAGLADQGIGEALRSHEALACAKFDVEQTRRLVARGP